MPFEKQSLGGGRFKVVNTQSGNVHSRSTTSKKADSQLRLLRAEEHGTLKPRTTRQVIGKHPQSGSSHGSGHKRKKGKVDATPR